MAACLHKNIHKHIAYWQYDNMEETLKYQIHTASSNAMLFSFLRGGLNPPDASNLSSSLRSSSAYN